MLSACWEHYCLLGCRTMYRDKKISSKRKLPVRQTALTEDVTCPSDCTYRRCYLSIRLTALTEDFTFPSDWLHLPKILPARQTALTEDVTCPLNCTCWRCYVSVKLHLLKIGVACNVNPRRQHSSGIARQRQKYGNFSCNKTFTIFFCVW